jgi:hypothetical protein
MILWAGFAATLVISHVIHYAIASSHIDFVRDVSFAFGKEEGLKEGSKMAYQQGRLDGSREQLVSQDVWTQNEIKDRKQIFADLRDELDAVIKRVYENRFGLKP